MRVTNVKKEKFNWKNYQAELMALIQLANAFCAVYFTKSSRT